MRFKELAFMFENANVENVSVFSSVASKDGKFGDGIDWLSKSLS